MKWFVPGALITIYLAQCAWFIETQSLTYDEPVTIYSGLQGWREGRISRFIDHPTFSRLLTTIPLTAPKWQVEIPPVRTNPSIRLQPDPISMARRARWMNVILGVALGFLLWAAVSYFSSHTAANFVLGLFVLSPSVIAHFSVATNDGATTLALFATAMAVVYWHQAPTWKRTLLVGIAAGFMATSKISVLPQVFLAIGLVLVLQSSDHFVSLRPTQWNWGKALAVGGLSFLVLWSSYFFRFSSFEIFHRSFSLPAGDFLNAINFQRYHNLSGHSSIFWGEVSNHGGWMLYYPTVILLKWPSAVLFLFLTAIVLLLLRRVRLPRHHAIAFAFPVMFFPFALMTRVNIGERLILPIYPFALFLCAIAWEWARSQRKTITIAFLALIPLLAVDVARYAPDYLSYFTPFFVSEQKYMYLSDSNIDWGQGLLALREYEKQNPTEDIHLAYLGSVIPSQYGIRASLMKPNDHPTGTVIVSAAYLSGLTLDDPAAYRWVLHYPIKTVLNHSLFVFTVPAQS